MPPDKSIPGNVQDWLVRAKGHLALVKQPKPAGAFWEDQCFLAQQAAEKALKAVYLPVRRRPDELATPCLPLPGEREQNRHT